MIKSKFNKILITLLLLLQVDFFSMLPSVFSPINSYFSKPLSFSLIIILFVINIKRIGSIIFKRNIPYVLTTLLIIVFTSILQIYSSFKYGQSFYQTLSASYYIYAVVLYFVLVSNFSKIFFEYLSNNIIIIGFIYSLLIIVQDLLLRSNIIFMNLVDGSMVETNSTVLGFYRIKYPADFIVFSLLVLSFYFLNSKKIKFGVFIYLTLTFYIIFISQVRIYVFVVIISFLILILKFLYRRNQLIFALFTAIIPISFLMSLNKILEIFVSGNRSDSYFARQGEISFYLNEVSENGIMGIGFPNTLWNHWMLHGNTYLLTNYGYQYYLDDVGFIGFYTIFGFFGIIIYISLFLKTIIIFFKSNAKFQIALIISYLIVTSISLSLFNIQRILYLPLLLFYIYYFSVFYKKQ